VVVNWWDKESASEELPPAAPLATFEEAKRRRLEKHMGDLAAAQRAAVPDHPVERPLWISAWPCRNCGQTRSVHLCGSIYLCDDCGGGQNGDTA